MQMLNIHSTKKLCFRMGVLHTPQIAKVCNVATMVRGAVHAVVYRAYAIRPYKWRKTQATKTTSDMGKTMSGVEKIMSDIIQTTSDLFSPLCNALFSRKLKRLTDLGEGHRLSAHHLEMS